MKNFVKTTVIKKKWEDPDYRERQRVGRIGKMVVPKSPLVADGIQYESLTAAALAHGITVQAARYRVGSKNFPEWKEEIKT